MGPTLLVGPARRVLLLLPRPSTTMRELGDAAQPTARRRGPTVDIQLLLALVLGITTIVVLVLRTRLDAFVALLIAALVTGASPGNQPWRS